MKLFICTGDTIQEHIDFIGMSNVELAARLKMDINELDKVIKGETRITNELSIKLEKLLDVPSKFWLKLDEQS